MNTTNTNNITKFLPPLFRDRVKRIKKTLNRKKNYKNRTNSFFIKTEKEIVPFIKNKIFANSKKNNTVIIAENDFLALKTRYKLIEQKIEIPKRIGLTGFDNIKLLNEIGCSLTTIVNPYKEMVKKCI